MRGNPSQEKRFDERAIKVALMEKIKKYERIRRQSLKDEIENIIKNCFEQDINVSREQRIFEKIVESG